MSKRTKAVVVSVTALLLASWVYDPLPPLNLIEKPVIKARTKATMEEKRENRRITIEYSRALGYTKRETACLVTLWTSESRFDHLANNKRSTAYGIAQLLGERSGEPAIQVLHGLRYIGKRYRESACRALAFHRHHHWY